MRATRNPMSQSVLTDKNVFPTDAVIHSHLGRTAPLWQAVFEHIRTQHPDVSAEWRYYNDGKSWLLKVTRKAKTVCWVAVIADAFRMTFYFTDKAEDAILSSSISDGLKEQFTAAKGHGKLRGLTIIFKKKRDVEDAKAMVALKLSIK